MNFKTRLKPRTSLIDLTPLVDVVFLMLVFFIITSDILPFKSLNVETPQIDLPSPPRTTQILVVVDAHNVIYVGNKKEIVDLESFQEALYGEINRSFSQHPDAELSIVLSIDKRVEYGTFLRLFALASASGIDLRLSYQDLSVLS